MSLNQLLNPAKLRRMSALRQALAISVIFVVLIGLAGFVAMSQFERELQKRIENELTVRFATVNNDIETGVFDAVRYPDTQTDRVEFNPVPLDIDAGFYNQLNFVWGVQHGTPMEDDNFRSKNGRGQWMYLVGPSGNGQLIVGTNLGRQDDFLEIMLQTMAGVGLAAAVAALGLGLLLGARTQRRITAISKTMTQVGLGDLNARVSASGTRDDLDDLSNQVDATIAQLDVLMRQTRDFAANIAHDLRTPLARLRIRLDRAIDDDSSENIDAATAQTDEIIAIFDAFLRIAKLESGSAKAAFEAINLGTLAEEVADIYEAVIEDSGRHLILEVSNPATIEGDRVLLVQMLANLIENAMRHTPKGTKITLIVQGATLGLADTGPGIAQDEYERISQPLYRLEKSRTTEGAGLGLSLVKTIASLHGAEMMFADNPSQPGSGLYVRTVFETTA